MTDTSNDKKKQFSLELLEGSDYVRLHTNFEFQLGVSSSVCFVRPLREEGTHWEKLMSTEKMIVQVLHQDGVVEVNLKPYYVSVRLGRMFDRHKVVEWLRELLTVIYSAEEIIGEAEPAAS